MVGVVAVVGSNWFDGLFVCGSVDGLCLCVLLCCGWVVAEVVGSSGFPMGFFFFFSFCCDVGFYLFIYFKYGFLFRWDFGE